MTGPSRGLPDPLHESRGASSAASTATLAEGTPRRRRRRQSGALERHLSNVIDVEEASRLVECSQIQRQLRFQQLVRRYISQILYGCSNPYCTTPTCLSCKKRLTSKPFRAPTQLTARALAHFLASQDDPHTGLCPNQLKVSPSALEIEGAGGVEILKGEGGKGSTCNVYPAPRPPLAASAGISTCPGSSTSTAKRDGHDKSSGKGEVDKIWTTLGDRHQAKKDVRSLGQNLFDTATVVYSYSKQIPSALSVFNSLRSLRTPRQKVSVTEQHHDSGMTVVKQRHVDSSSAEATGHANGHTVQPRVSGCPAPTAVAPPHSLRSQRSHPKTSSAHIMPEILSNGHRIHRIRHHLPDSLSNGQAPLKIQDTAPFDGTQERPPSYNSKMKRKPLSLDLNYTPKADPPIISLLTANQDDRNEKASEPMGLILPVASHLDCQIMDQLKDEVYHHRNQQSSDFTFVVDYDTNARFRPAKPFVNRSLFFTFSDPETLLKSFCDSDNNAYKHSPLPHLNSTRLTHTFRDWNRRNGALLFDSLWIALNALFVPPPELDVQKSPRLRAAGRSPSLNGSASYSSTPSNSEAPSGRYLSDKEAAHIVMICIHALTSLVPVGWPHSWVQVRKFRSWGIILPDAPPHTDFTDGFSHPLLNTIDELEYEPALRLAGRLVRGIGARACFEDILVSLGHREDDDGWGPMQRGRSELMRILVRHLEEVEHLAVANKMKMKTKLNYDEDPGWTVTATFIEWLRTIIIKKWNGKAEVNRWGNVGAAIRILFDFYDNRESLNLRTNMFHIPYLNEHLDLVKEPMKFLSRGPTINSFHLLQCPFLFTPRDLVAHFRTINFTRMYKQFEETERAMHLQRELDPFLREPYWWLIRSRLKVTFTDYLVLDVRREHALEDTLNQLWGQEKRLLMKPLKVKMGQQEGEVGLDQGGVTYEFFRVVLSEAFNPDKGMFTIDPQTRMTWFHPATVEPPRKFELLGVLFSLAIYNGITLPVTFPLAFYKYLLGIIPTTVNDIRDGWPALAKSFDQLLSWEDGDVADVFLRSYTFSYESFGTNIDVDMQEFERVGPEKNVGWLNNPSQQHMTKVVGSDNQHDPEKEASMVTNSNREQFVKDYILWLTLKSVEVQLRAFRKGFLSCIHGTSLDLFEPGSLQALIEGSQEVSVSALKAATHYEEGYHAAHPIILDFWSIVQKYDNDDRKKLLEFVTATDRVPVTGFETMNFCIVRNGGDSEMLPTSSTCFGKLMLPEYKGKEKLEEKLALAIQNCKGFGVV
ncbi:uncharacterized protein BDR25DRAFT_304945 [Lindgomyces ingoldianus]|uniref:Uncharacterized protein n=1 Tax=Lindgomyces ingoldianus TaxID=673940 RepID=A0ACB6QQG1_9PLEO|nr:uncharacterized protein BDR25DRAFT_304945 [Lindgomyces ingoldianus]KAF2468522.1 hypothetical protein BDR25DRAFT_304945 [Lindgomyces ingoldianus]